MLYTLEGDTQTEVRRREFFINVAELELQGLSYRAIAIEWGYSDHKNVTKCDLY